MAMIEEVNITGIQGSLAFKEWQAMVNASKDEKARHKTSMYTRGARKKEHRQP